ncbi:serine/threonine-protein kinase 31-like isoform X2 [Mizuhopecten yessoensis]|uniref:serine/threonine-protein kinase 31-like isoform X2 n=1 Tax=Mizuhopecten yessoensis TaxID=6573 RepID=UPI000B45C3D2|nr:serine/threonine-protein kinase 31-like isoform X2 [Mizuhopecten yessoensis]
MAKRATTYDVFVGNLPTDANERNVGKIFSKFGEIQGIVVKEQSNNPQIRYAFVKYLCEPDAEKACSELNGQEVQGKKVSVRLQEQRKGRPIGQGKDANSLQHRPPGSRISKTSQPDIVPEGADSDNMSNTGSTGSNYNEKESVMVTFVESCVTVWVQVVNEENTNKLMKITDQLAALCPAASKVNDSPQQSKVYAAQFSEDNMWYRCGVKQFVGTDKVKVQYIDYGNSEEISVNSLVDIPQTLASNKPLATKFILHNTKANKFNDVNGISLLRKLTEGKVIEAVRTRKLGDGNGYYALIYLDGQSINDMMIEEGYATKRPPANARTTTESSDQSGGNQLFGSGDPLAGTSSLRYNRFGSGDGGPFALGGGGYAGDAAVSGGPFPQGRHLAQSNIGGDEMLRNDLNKKKREVDRLRGEVAKRDLQLQQLTANKVQLQSVVDLADKVKRLRVQFPTGRSSGLEEAMALALSNEKVQNSSVHSLQAVMSTMSTYKAAQKEIICSSNHEELANMILERDNARRDLHGKLQECIDELTEMPLDTRYKALKDKEDKVMKDYKMFIGFNVHGCPLLEDLAFGFKDWKSRKEEEFCLVRENCDTCQNNMTAFLQRLLGLMSLEAPTEVTNSVVDMDNLLRSYSQALQQELVITDLEHSSDANMVATILAAILKELRGEMKTLENLKGVASDFTNLKSSIEPWLEARPNLESITDRRKAIRSLKSKLRHKEADRQDIEESGDGTKEEMAEIQREVNELKYKLHKELLAMDDLLGYGGLVKLGRDIEHYTLQQTSRTGMYSSVFANKPVYIQELHINDDDHVNKEEFVQHIIAYADVASTCDFLMKLDAIFFSKNERTAYIQMEWSEMQLLPDLMKKGAMADQVKQSVFEGVTEGLMHLHNKGFVHGEVNPSNIGVKPDGSSTLMPPDFSRSVLDRVRKRYVTENGLTFVPIEMVAYAQQGLTPQVSISCDLYNHGLLLLWLHNPHGSVELQHDGSPKLMSMGLESTVMELLYSQLFPVCDKRLPLKQILKSRYLTQVIPDKPAPDTTLSIEVSQVQVSDSEVKEGADNMPTAELSVTAYDPEADLDSSRQFEHQPVEDTMSNIGVFDFNNMAATNSSENQAEQALEPTSDDTSAVDQLARDLASISMPAYQTDLSGVDGNTELRNDSLSGIVSEQGVEDNTGDLATTDSDSVVCVVDSEQAEDKQTNLVVTQTVKEDEEMPAPPEPLVTQSEPSTEPIGDLELVTSSFASPHSFLRQDPSSRSPIHRLLKAAASKESL